MNRTQAASHAMRKELGVHFASRSADWSTPADLFAELNDIFHFDLDACASAENAKCARFFTKEQDALSQHWQGTVWMNPPYGQEIAAFMCKAYCESLSGATVVCLVPSRTDTDWWHRFARQGQVIYLKGRLRFGGNKNSAPFPSAIVIFWGGRLGIATRTNNSALLCSSADTPESCDTQGVLPGLRLEAGQRRRARPRRN